MTTTMTKTQQSKDIEDLGHDDNSEERDDINDKDVGRGQG